MQLFNANLDGYELKILDITDTISGSVIRHEFLNYNGALLEDLGLKAREIRFKAFFFGSVPVTQYSAEYSNHVAFINKIMDGTKVHTLTHPKYGRIKGLVESASMIHDDTQDYVAIDITFVQHSVAGGTVPDKASLANMKQLQAAHVTAQLKKMNSQISALGHAGIVGKVLDTSKSILANFQNVSNKTRNFVKSVDSFVGKLDSFLGDIEQPVKTINSAVNYVGDLPSTVIGKIQDCTDRVVGSFSNLSNLPVSLINNSIMSIRSLKDSITGENADFFQEHIIAIGAGTITAESANILTDDEATAAQAKKAESERSFDINGKRVSAITVYSVMSSTEMELLVYTVGAMIQEAIDDNRDAQSLKSMYNALIGYMDDTKLSRMAMVNMQLNSIPLHVLCVQLGLSYSAADRLLKINPQIKNPTFADGTTRVYVR